MERRSFLQGVVGVGAIAALPISMEQDRVITCMDPSAEWLLTLDEKALPIGRVQTVWVDRKLLQQVDLLASCGEEELVHTVRSFSKIGWCPRTPRDVQALYPDFEVLSYDLTPILDEMKAMSADLQAQIDTKCAAQYPARAGEVVFDADALNGVMDLEALLEA